MSAFKRLQDVSNSFAAELQQTSDVLYSVKAGGDYEDYVSKKVKNLNLYSAKLKLLRAQQLSLSPQITTKHTDEAEYNSVVTSKVVELVAVKSFMHSQSVKDLITAQNGTLTNEQSERKENIVLALSNYKDMECRLRELDDILRRNEIEQDMLRDQWYKELGELRELKHRNHFKEEIVDTESNIYSKLCRIVDKMEYMRWLINALVNGRSQRSVMDPRKTLSALKLARSPNTIDKFISADSRE